MRVLCLLSALLFGQAAGVAHAQPLELEECIDASGQALRGESDPSLKVLVRAETQGGRRVIRYNPDLLPKMSAMAKQFFFAHECAKASIGAKRETEPTQSLARNADCTAVSTLRAAGLLDEPGALEALQAELSFSDEEWVQLPGPRRTFNLKACPQQAGVVLPLPKSLTQDQAEWNACVRQCGDRLLLCQGSCRGSSCEAECQGTYDRCEAACRTR